jgi:hypothetical protein
MLRNQNLPNNILQPFLVNIFTIIKQNSHVYPSHFKVHGLKFLLEKKKWEIIQIFIFNCHGPFKNHAFEL